jgi:hypothetical protein
MQIPLRVNPIQIAKPNRPPAVSAEKNSRQILKKLTGCLKRITQSCEFFIVCRYGKRLIAAIIPIDTSKMIFFHCLQQTAAIIPAKIIAAKKNAFW